MELRPKDPGAARSPTNPSSEPASPEYPPSARSSLLRSVSAYLPKTARTPSPTDQAGPAKRRSEPGLRSSQSERGLLSAVPERLRPRRSFSPPEAGPSPRGSLEVSDADRAGPRRGPSFRPKHIVTSDLVTEDMVAAPRAFSPRFLQRQGSARRDDDSPRLSPPRSPYRRSFTTPGGKLFKRASWGSDSGASIVHELAGRLERLERQGGGRRSLGDAADSPGTPSLADDDFETGLDSVDDFASARGADDASLGGALEGASPGGFARSAGVPLEKQMDLLRREAKVNEWQRRLEQQEADLCAFRQNQQAAEANRRYSRLASALTFRASPESPGAKPPSPKAPKKDAGDEAPGRHAPGDGLSGLLATLVFDPQGSDWFMVLATVLLVFAIAGAAEAPLVWGFREAPAGAWRATVIFADVLFLVNVALGPLKAYVDKHTLLLVRDVRRTGKRYARTWLLCDALAAVPLAATLGTPYVFLRLFRAGVVFQYSWIFHYVDRTTASSAATFRLFRLFVFYVFLGHLLSCCYWRIATSADDGRYGGAEWWTVSAEMEAAALGHRWLFATTKSLTLLLGEDTAPGTAVECGFVCATISLGVFGLSVVIGQVTLVASDLDAIGRKKTEQVDAVLLYLRYRGVPGDVSKEIVRFIEYMWNSGQAEHETAGLETLPDSLKLRLDLALKQQLIRKVPLFEDLPPTGVVAVVRALQSLVVIPGEVIVHEGHEGHEMFFIGSGSVRVYKRREDGSDIELAQLHAGSFFGEMALLEAQLRMASIAALTFCDLFVLSASDYEDISQSNSSLRDALHAFARKRRDSNADKLQALGTAPAEGDGGDETRVLVDDADAEQDALRHQLVKRVPIFEGVPPSAVLSIVNALQALVVAPGELIVKEGNDGGEMFLIAKGSVRIFKERSADHFDDDGDADRVVEIARLNAGSFFGEKALLEEKARRNASVAAVTDCHVYVLSKTDYDRIASLNSTMRRAGLEKKARALGSRAPHHVAPTVHLR